jgi:hypothetical protein
VCKCSSQGSCTTHLWLFGCCSCWTHAAPGQRCCPQQEAPRHLLLRCMTCSAAGSQRDCCCCCCARQTPRPRALTTLCAADRAAQPTHSPQSPKSKNSIRLTKLPALLLLSPICSCPSCESLLVCDAAVAESLDALFCRHMAACRHKQHTNTPEMVLPTRQPLCRSSISLLATCCATDALKAAHVQLLQVAAWFLLPQGPVDPRVMDTHLDAVQLLLQLPVELL